MSDENPYGSVLAETVDPLSRFQGASAMNQSLPHDPYMAATANALAAWGLTPATWWSAEEDDRLDGVFQWDTTPPEHWPHGVYLSWDQRTGWNLIEAGGSRNLHRLPNCRTYCDPQQVASDTRAFLAHGPDAVTPGPITLDARWDLRETQAAVQRWEEGEQ